MNVHHCLATGDEKLKELDRGCVTEPGSGDKENSQRSHYVKESIVAHSFIYHIHLQSLSDDGIAKQMPNYGRLSRRLQGGDQVCANWPTPSHNSVSLTGFDP
jgi:hypothetical protein